MCPLDTKYKNPSLTVLDKLKGYHMKPCDADTKRFED